MTVSAAVYSIASMIVSAITGAGSKVKEVSDQQIDRAINAYMSKMAPGQAQSLHAKMDQVKSGVKADLRGKGFREAAPSLVSMYLEAGKKGSKPGDKPEKPATKPRSRINKPAAPASGVKIPNADLEKAKKAALSIVHSQTDKIAKELSDPSITTERRKYLEGKRDWLFKKVIEVDAVSDFDELNKVNIHAGVKPAQPPVKPVKPRSSSGNVVQLFPGKGNGKEVVSQPGPPHSGPRKPNLSAEYTKPASKMRGQSAYSKIPTAPVAPPTPRKPLSLASVKSSIQSGADKVVKFSSANPGKTATIGVAVGVIISAGITWFVQWYKRRNRKMTDAELRSEINLNLEKYLSNQHGGQSTIQRAKMDSKFRKHLVDEIFEGTRSKVLKPGQQTPLEKAGSYLARSGREVARHAGNAAVVSASNFAKHTVQELGARTVNALSLGYMGMENARRSVGIDVPSQKKDDKQAHDGYPFSKRDVRRRVAQENGLLTPGQANKKARQLVARERSNWEKQQLKLEEEFSRAPKVLKFSDPKVQRAVSAYIEREKRGMGTIERKLLEKKLSNPSEREVYRFDIYKLLEKTNPEMISDLGR